MSYRVYVQTCMLYFKHFMLLKMQLNIKLIFNISIKNICWVVSIELTVSYYLIFTINFF